VVERILQAVRAMPWSQLGEGLAVTLSVGLCESADFGDSSELVRRADEALYGAKDAGRDRLHVWSADRA
jgi:PleD family two-component response regulator